VSDAFADLMQALPPERLVPGDPDGVDQMAQTMLRFSEVFADAAHALGLVDVLWLGRAAQAFQDEFELQPAAFKNAALAFHDAGFALGSHAISMYSARQSVGAALQVFQRGVRAAHDAQSVAAVVGGLPTSGPLNLRPSRPDFRTGSRASRSSTRHGNSSRAPGRWPRGSCDMPWLPCRAAPGHCRRTSGQLRPP